MKLVGRMFKTETAIRMIVKKETHKYVSETIFTTCKYGSDRHTNYHLFFDAETLIKTEGTSDNKLIKILFGLDSE